MISLLNRNPYFLIFFVLIISPVRAHKDRFEDPRDITISYSTGEEIKISFSQNEIQSILVSLPHKLITVPDAIIKRISSIHYHTLSLLWDGTYASASDAPYFYLRFEAGQDTYYGKYPIIELHFDQNGFSKGVSNQKINEGTWQRSIF